MRKIKQYHRCSFVYAHLSTLCKLLLISPIFLHLPVIAKIENWNIEIRGSISENYKPLNSSKVSLYIDSTLIRTISCTNGGTFDFLLQPGNDYILTFSNTDYITTSILFSTKNVPLSRAQEGFSPYDIEVNLTKKIQGEELEQSVNTLRDIVRYDPSFNGGDFVADKVYAASIEPYHKIFSAEVKDVKNTIELRNQKAIKAGQHLIVLYASGSICILVLGFGLLIRSRHKLLLKARVKNMEMTDSLNYAQRIQTAILPKQEVLQEIFPDSFILFKPKDIVSGDFYWIASPGNVSAAEAGNTFTTGENNGTVLIAAADCTGHGVPGAFMSFVGYEKLELASKTSCHPGKVLNLINNGVRLSLHQTNDLASNKDGMDIALCLLTLNKEGANLQFSGANRPLWILRKGSCNIEEIKPTKRPIAGFATEDQEYETVSVQIGNGDAFYMFSDGYADQFGGKNGKKLTTAKFKKSLLDIKEMHMIEQAAYLEKFLNEWMVNEEQVDDVLVIGIRI